MNDCLLAPPWGHNFYLFYRHKFLHFQFHSQRSIKQPQNKNRQMHTKKANNSQAKLYMTGGAQWPPQESKNSTKKD